MNNLWNDHTATCEFGAPHKDHNLFICVIYFLFKSLFLYTTIGGSTFGNGEVKFSLIFSRLFNVRFESE